MDEEDVRYDIFSMIYDMLFDNIQLRIKQNKLSGRILTQANLNIDKMVTGYFRTNHKMINGAIELSSLKFRTKLQERKNTKNKGTPGGEASSVKQTTEAQDEEYYDEEEEQMSDIDIQMQAMELRKETDPNKSKEKDNSKQLNYDEDPAEDAYLDDYEAEEPELLEDLMMDDDMFAGPKGA